MGCCTRRILAIGAAAADPYSGVLVEAEVLLLQLLLCTSKAWS